MRDQGRKVLGKGGGGGGEEFKTRPKPTKTPKKEKGKVRSTLPTAAGQWRPIPSSTTIKGGKKEVEGLAGQSTLELSLKKSLAWLDVAHVIVYICDGYVWDGLNVE